MDQISLFEKKAKLLRKHCLVSTSEAGSGHPTSCLSSVDLVTVLFEKYFKYDLKDPLNVLNDRLIFSKGHAAPLLYALFALSGAFSVEQLKTLRKFDSPLEGHPTPNFKYAEAATGSLGQGLSVGAGLAYGIRSQVQSSKFKVQSFPKVFVLMGDGELAEGSVWEAVNFASIYKLENLIAIADINGLGQSQQTMFNHHMEEYEKRFSAFGFDVLLIDGHNFTEIDSAFKKAINNKSGKPVVILAKTEKGKGVSFLEGKDGWHGKPLKKDDLEKALIELGEVDEGLRFNLNMARRIPNYANDARHTISKSSSLTPSSLSERRLTDVYSSFKNISLSAFSSFASWNTPGLEIATREVYGKVLAKLAELIPQIYVLDADVKNSTYSMDFKKVFPERFIECFIAEQNMVGVALGLARFGYIPFVSTFSAFLTRAFDQIRMAGISMSNVKFVGSYAGVSIGEDGLSQMGLEDISMFSVIPGSVIFHPCDAMSTSNLIYLMASNHGIFYLRTLRPKTPVIYDKKEEFKIGGSKVLRNSKRDELTVVACGITVHEAIKAYEELKKEGILIRVVDCYSIKPIDKKTIEQCSSETIKPIIVTVEDHYEYGGLGDHVLSALAMKKAHIVKMAVSKMPRSGLINELLNYENIDKDAIVEKVKSLL